MSNNLLSDIEAFLRETGMSPSRFGFRAARNSRLVERLREGRTPKTGKPAELMPSTEARVRAFIAAEREARRERVPA